MQYSGLNMRDNKSKSITETHMSNGFECPICRQERRTCIEVRRINLTLFLGCHNCFCALKMEVLKDFAYGVNFAVAHPLYSEGWNEGDPESLEIDLDGHSSLCHPHMPNGCVVGCKAAVRHPDDKKIMLDQGKLLRDGPIKINRG